MRKSKLAVFSLLAVSVVSLTSCGNSGSNNDRLVIGLECNYAPFNWTESSPNDYTLNISNRVGYADGYDIQLAKLLGEELGKEVVIVQTEWDALVTDLQAGSINCIIAGMTDTEERRLSIDFTDEYYRSELVLVTSKVTADFYTSALDAEAFRTLIDGQFVISQNNTVTNDVIGNVFTTYGARHANPVESFALAATDVVNNSAFAMTAELPVANSIVAANSSLGIVHIEQAILGETQSELGVSIGIQKGNTELRDELNRALATISSEQRTELMSQAVIRSSQN